MENANTESKEKKLPDPFGVIEKAGDISLVAQILALALFLETLLLVFKHKSLLTFAWHDVNWSAEVGEIIVSGLMYALVLSVVLPLIEVIMTVVCTWYPLQKILETYEEKDAQRRPRGCVRDYELKEKADAEQSTYLLEKYNQAVQRAQNVERRIKNLGTGALRVMAMLGLNIYFSTPEVTSTVMRARTVWPANNVDFAIAVLFIVLFWMCVRSWRRPPFPDVWINYQPLFEEIERKHQEQRKLYGV